MIHTPSSIESDRVRPEPADMYGDSPREQRSLIDLLRELRDETATLIRQEVELVRVETTENAKRTARNIGYLALGGIIGFAGFMFLLWSLTLGMMVAMTEGGASQNVALWVAPLITGLLVGGLAAGFIAKALATLKDEPMQPEETLETMKENKQWLTEKLS